MLNAEIYTVLKLLLEAVEKVLVGDLALSPWPHLSLAFTGLAIPD